MTDQQKLPSDALKVPRRTWRTVLLATASVVAVAGLSVGGVAIAQTLNSTAGIGTQAEVETTPTEDPNLEPTASFSVLGVDGRTISVDGANSIDPDGAIADYAWNFGDGNTATGATATHKYSDYGTFTVTLTVTDGDGATGEFSADVTLNEPPPPPPPTPTKCPAGTTPGAVDAEGNESACQDLNNAGQQCVAYNDANECTQWYKP
jgi:PKD repeat protein